MEKNQITPLQLETVAAQFNSLSPPNGERAGVRGKYLKIKVLFTLVLSIVNRGEKPN